MSKHTPGPWHVREFLNGRCAIQAESGRAVGSTPSHPGENGPGHWNDLVPEDAANARLMASAPEMLEALKLALEQLEPTSKPKLIQEPAFALREIQAAIAKAEGRE